MNIDWQTKLYFLIGDPVEKTLSPKLQNFIFKDGGTNSLYMAFKVEDKDLEKAIDGFRAINVGGFNVTIPHKQKVMKYLDEISDEAKAIGAVNTVNNVNGKLIGYNTDGPGLVQSMKNECVNIKDKNILILGAGGAGLGVSYAIGLEEPNSITIANRTLEKGEKLKYSLEKYFNFEVKLMDLSLKGLDKGNIDIVINTTSVGMYPKEDEKPISLQSFRNGIVVYDIIYKPLKTKLIEEAEGKSCKTFNGVDMLLAQGIMGQKIWRGEEISKDSIRKLYDIF